MSQLLLLLRQKLLIEDPQHTITYTEEEWFNSLKFK